MQKGVAFIFTFFLSILLFTDVCRAQESSTLGNHSDDVESVAVSGNGKFIATGSWDNTVQVFKGDTTFPFFQLLTGHRAAVSALCFSGDGEVLITGGNDFKLMVWNKLDKDRFELDKEYTGVHSAGINSIAVSPEGNMIYSAGDDGRIVIHNQRSNSKWVIDNKLPVNSISLKGRTYIFCADESPVVKLYDINGRVIKQYKGHQDAVNAVASNGQYLVTGSSDKTVIIWDVISGKQKHILKGHSWKINSVTISNDGKYVISGSSDGSTKVWDIETGEEYKTYNEANGKVRQVQISHDMRYVFSAYQVDSIGKVPTYGLSVWQTGLVYDYDNSLLAKQLSRINKQRIIAKTIAENTSDTKEKTPNNAKPEITETPKPELKGEVIIDTEEIQITIEDE